VSEYWDQFYGKQGRRSSPPSTFAVKAIPWIKNANLKRVLDLGCGDGVDAVLFAENGCDVVCTDFSKEAIKKACKNALKRKVKIKALVHDMIEPLQFSNESFDVVFAHLSLHYFDDKTTAKIFSEITRILKIGGLLFVKVKSIDDPLYGKGEKVGENTFKFGYARHFFSQKYLLRITKQYETIYLQQVCEETHYAVKEVSPTSVFLEYIGKKTGMKS